jgi:hypothetical protein
VKTIGNNQEVVVLDSGSRSSHGGGDEVMGGNLARTLLEGIAPLASVEDGILACVAAFGIDQAMEEGRVVDFDTLEEMVDSK